MPRDGLEVADIFRAHGPAWRQSRAGHVSLGQLKVMAAVEACRTAALGGHVAVCQGCAHSQIAYNSCRNRHCPKCQGAAARAWLTARQADLLPVAYYHVVFKPPFAGPEAVLTYLARYTHRVAIANSRLTAFDGRSVTFKWKDYRASSKARYKLMTLAASEFIRRFLIHVLPQGFHRIRHYGFFANGGRAGNLARARHLLEVEQPRDQCEQGDENKQPPRPTYTCPSCGSPMIIIETFEPRYTPGGHRSRAPPPNKADRA